MQTLFEKKFSLDQLPEVASMFLQKTAPHQVFAFMGDLGAGKTTFIRAVLELVGVKDFVGSPTYAYIHTYRSGSIVVYHLDLYRMHSVEEFVSLGFDEIVRGAVQDKNRYVFIEWPELIKEMFKSELVVCELKHGGDELSRQICAFK